MSAEPDVVRVESGLDGFATWLSSRADAEVHLADPDGGWTVAQCVSHVQLSAVCLVAAIARTADRADLVVFREEMGHDALGATPHSAEEAAARIRSASAAVVEAINRITASQLEHRMLIAPIGELTVAQVVSGSVDHLLGHVEQARAIVAARRLWPADRG